MSGFRARLVASYVLCMVFLVVLAEVGIHGVRTVAAASPETEAATVSATTRGLVLLIVIGGVVAVICAWWLVQQASRPLRELHVLFSAAADGDLSRRGAWKAHDEFGELVGRYNAMADALTRTLRVVAVDAGRVSAAAEELTLVSGEIGVGAGESAARALVVASAAEQVSSHVRGAAAATEEMGAAIREIARSTGAAAGMATEAVDALVSANATVSQLSSSSVEIGSVVKVISGIAEQTNLLALNATIEAARAGDAGRGFAVVAGEVKELARETSLATQDVGRRIDAIQADSHAAALAIAEISAIIGRINETQSSIATAIEEQTATAGELSRGVVEASLGTDEIAASITGVADAAVRANDGVRDTLLSCTELTQMSVDLADAVGNFVLADEGTASGQYPTSAATTATPPTIAAGRRPGRGTAGAALSPGGRGVAASPFAPGRAGTAAASVPPGGPAASARAGGSADLASPASGARAAVRGDVSGQITLAIGAHGAWKRRLAVAVESGVRTDDPALVARDDRCAFGRWLSGMTTVGAGHTPATGSADADHSARCRALHAAFHREAAAVLRHMETGSTAQARAALEPGGSFSTSSRQLTKAMIEWRSATEPVLVGTR